MRRGGAPQYAKVSPGGAGALAFDAAFLDVFDEKRPRNRPGLLRFSHDVQQTQKSQKCKTVPNVRGARASRPTTAEWNERIVKDRGSEGSAWGLPPRSNLAECAADFSSYFWPAGEAPEAGCQLSARQKDSFSARASLFTAYTPSH